MKAEYVNTVILSTVNLLKEWVNEDFRLVNKNVVQIPVTSKELTILVGMKGRLKGHVILSLSGDVAKVLATKMTGGFVFETVDEMLKSAIGELMNIIMGRVCMSFSELELNVDITPPVVIEGVNTKLSVKVSPLLNLEFKSESLEFNLILALEEE